MTRQINSLHEMTLLLKGFKVDGVRYTAEMNARRDECRLFYYTSEGAKECAGFLYPSNKRKVTVKRRMMGLNFEADIKFSEIEPIQ